jgi:hypothetical protein
VNYSYRDDLLLRLAKITDSNRFWLLHFAVAWAYSNIVPIFLFNYFAFKSGSLKLKVIPRHSALSRRSFNTFLSDLDISIVVPDNLEQKLTQYAKSHSFLRRFFLFLGEVELYTQTEFEQLNILLAKHGDIYFFLRDVRKIRWMELAITPHSTLYQKYKMQRAIQLSIHRLGLKMAANSENNLNQARLQLSTQIKKVLPISLENETLTPIAGPGAYSAYFQCHIHSDTTFDNIPNQFCCDIKLAYGLLALSPQYEFGSEPINDAIRAIRLSDSKTHSNWIALAKIEHLILRAVMRSFNEPPRWATAWLPLLEKVSHEPSISC